MKAFLSLFFSILFYSGLAQTLISKEEVAKVAKRFYSERAILYENIDERSISNSDIQTITKNNIPVYHVCQMKPCGFVLVSASKRVIPVIAYSFEMPFPDFESVPQGIRAWFDNYSKQIEFAERNSTVISTKIEEEWNHLLSETTFHRTSSGTTNSVDPLLVSKWNQDFPYNNLCPSDVNGPGGHCYAGCVATAMGQLLYYYRFPQTGIGDYTYTHPVYNTISANFEQANYDWYQMPTYITSPNLKVGELLFHQGVSVDMDYGPDGSGMWNHKAAYSLKTYFKYGPETQYYFRDSISLNWDSLIVANLNQRKPLYYAGWAGVQSNSGHAFVCDGYQPGNYYHFNWGWGGSLDGYFYTDNLTPGGNIFNFAQEIIPLFPDTVQYTYPQQQPDTVIVNSPTGSIDDGSGWYDYQNNISKAWIISPQTQENDSIQSIKILFKKFNIADDSLFIYQVENNNPTLAAVYTGNTLPANLNINANEVLVHFKSNSNTNADGWMFDFESKFPLYCSGITTLTGQNGIIEDGSGEKNYANNSLCRWKILPTQNKPVTLVFTSFALADSGDFVKIIDLQTQEIIANYTLNDLPQPLTVESGKVLIMFVSNGNHTENGWTLDYYASLTNTNENLNEQDCHVFPNPTSDGFSIQLHSETEKEIQCRLLGLSGIEYINKNFFLKKGENFFWIDTKNFPRMAYFLIIQDSVKIIERKIMIIK